MLLFHFSGVTLWFELLRKSTARWNRLMRCNCKFPELPSFVSALTQNIPIFSSKTTKHTHKHDFILQIRSIIHTNFTVHITKVLFSPYFIEEFLRYINFHPLPRSASPHYRHHETQTPSVHDLDSHERPRVRRRFAPFRPLRPFDGRWDFWNFALISRVCHKLTLHSTTDRPLHRKLSQ